MKIFETKINDNFINITASFVQYMIDVMEEDVQEAPADVAAGVKAA